MLLQVVNFTGYSPMRRTLLLVVFLYKREQKHTKFQVMLSVVVNAVIQIVKKYLKFE